MTQRIKVLFCVLFFVSSLNVICHYSESDLLPFLITFSACLLAGLEVGMCVGIFANLLFILYNSARPFVAIQWVSVGGENVLLITPRESLVFPATDYLRQVIVQTCCARDLQSTVVLDGYHINHIDSTVAKGMKVLTEDLAARKQSVYFWRWNEAAMATCLGFDPGLTSYFRSEQTLLQLIKGSMNGNTDSSVVIVKNGDAFSSQSARSACENCNGTS